MTSQSKESRDIFVDFPYQVEIQFRRRICLKQMLVQSIHSQQKSMDLLWMSRKWSQVVKLLVLVIEPNQLKEKETKLIPCGSLASKLVRQQIAGRWGFNPFVYPTQKKIPGFLKFLPDNSCFVKKTNLYIKKHHNQSISRHFKLKFSFIF